MNSIKALLMLIAFSLESKREILFFKYKMPSCEKNLKKMFYLEPFKNALVTYIENDYKVIGNQFIARSNLLFVQETQMYYFRLDEDLSRKILKALTIKQQRNYLKVVFDYHWRNYDKISTFKLIRSLNQPSSTDSIELSSKGDQLKVINIKDILLDFRLEYLELINRHGSSIDAEFLKKYASFEPLYFSNHFECFEALKSFFNPSNFLQIVDDSDIRSNTVKKSYLKERVQKKFKKDFELEKNYDTLCSTFEDVFNNHFLIKMRKHLLLPIVTKFDVEHHINNIYNLFYILFDELAKVQNLTKNKPKINFEIQKYLINLETYSIGEVFKFIENDIEGPRNLLKYYSVMYGKKEEYNIRDLEKIVCDYKNIMVSILNNINHDNPLYLYRKKYDLPVTNYQEESLIVKAFEFYNLTDNKIKSIKSYTFKGHEVRLKQNSDFFIFNVDKKPTYVVPFEIIREQKIDKIEVIFESGEKKYFNLLNSLLCEKISKIKLCNI